MLLSCLGLDCLGLDSLILLGQVVDPLFQALPLLLQLVQVFGTALWVFGLLDMGLFSLLGLDFLVSLGFAGEFALVPCLAGPGWLFCRNELVLV